MTDSLDSAMDKLKEMLSSDDGKENISSLLSSFMGGSDNSQPNKVSEKKPEKLPVPSTGDLGINPETLIKLTQAYKNSINKDDPRANLLRALRPYLSEKRASKLDNAIKLMSLTKLGSVVKDLNLF